MGLMDKAKDLAKDHGDQLDKGVDSAEAAAKKRLDDKYDGKIDTAADKGRDAIDGLGSK